jgi:hypothetical protein
MGGIYYKIAGMPSRGRERLPANSSFFNTSTNNNMMQNYLMVEQAKMKPVDLSSSVDTSGYCHNYGYDGTWDPVTKQCHWW